MFPSPEDGLFHHGHTGGYWSARRRRLHVQNECVYEDDRHKTISHNTTGDSTCVVAYHFACCGPGRIAARAMTVGGANDASAYSLTFGGFSAESTTALVWKPSSKTVAYVSVMIDKNIMNNRRTTIEKAPASIS